MRTRVTIPVNASYIRVVPGKSTLSAHGTSSCFPISALCLYMPRFRFTSVALILTLVAISAWLPIYPAEADSADARATKTVILVRHAEKCTEPASDPGLTSLGIERAESLRNTLKDVSVDAIYSTPFERTLLTVKGLSEDHDLEIIETPVSAGFLERLVQTIQQSEDAVIVVSGHSNTTARVVNLLAGTDYPDLEESEYDRLFVVHIPESEKPVVTALRYGPSSGPSSSPC